MNNGKNILTNLKLKNKYNINLLVLSTSKRLTCLSLKACCFILSKPWSILKRGLLLHPEQKKFYRNLIKI